MAAVAPSADGLSPASFFYALRALRRAWSTIRKTDMFGPDFINECKPDE
jgi:hypothetical protein